MAAKALLHYQGLPVAPYSKIGRYIDHEPKERIHCDEHVLVACAIRDARGEASLNWATVGFELVANPTACNFLSRAYYDEVAALVKRSLEAHGEKVAEVVVFDHTVRSSATDSTKLNAVDGASTAAPVNRVHCDYTAASAPRRLRQLATKKSYTGVGIDPSTVENVFEKRRYAFVNVWRSIDRDHPVVQRPLALMEHRGLDLAADRVLTYELCFPERVGENYSLSAEGAQHDRWWYYPDMTADECLVFSVYDRKPDRPRFVFHTAFDLENNDDFDRPPRRSIEARTIVIFDEEVTDD